MARRVAARAAPAAPFRHRPRRRVAPTDADAFSTWRASSTAGRPVGARAAATRRPRRPTPIIGSSAANEVNAGGGNDRVDAAAGDDEIEGGAGNDEFEGGPGTDILEFNYSATGVTVDLGAGIATGQGSDVVSGIENLRGSIFDDVLIGDEAVNGIRGNLGSDVLDGRAGDDGLAGERGNDRMDGGDGDDDHRGGLGDDVHAGGAGDDFLVDDAGNEDSVRPVTVDLFGGFAEGHGSDTVVAFEGVIGSNFADYLRGDSGPNALMGLRYVAPWTPWTQ